MKDLPEISICIFSYNFGSFLTQSIESVLNQKVDVPIEIIIGDDFSTDNSMEIINDYAVRYPSIIKVIKSDENIGGTRNWLRCINASRGKYIALLDGDDFFTDQFKLQQQYNLMERHSDAALCFHAVREIYEGVAGTNRASMFHKELFSLSDIIKKGWFIRTGSMFFRNKLIPSVMPTWVYDFPYRLDSILPVMLCMHGNARYISEVMSVWRKHSRGMSYYLHEDEIKNALTKINLSNKLDEFTGLKYHKESAYCVSKIYTELFLRILRSDNLMGHRRLLMKILVNMNYGYLVHLAKKKYFGFAKA